MKKINYFPALLAMLLVTNIVQAQTNILPTTGNVGIGTLSPTKNLQVMGTTQLGSKKNALNVSAAGKLSFLGTGAYVVDSGQYVFQNSNNSNYGLFFGQPTLRYEFRDQNAVATFFVNANTGNGYFSGKLGIGVKNPATKLDVNGDINISKGSVLKLNGNPIFVSDSNYNLFVGEGAGIYNTAGYNTGTGYNTLHFNTTGYENTANGYKALYLNTTGNYNTASGSQALYLNTTGQYNTASGNSALYVNTTGSSNTATGMNSLYSNISGDENTATGSYSLFNNTIGYSNTANGYYSLYANTTGYDNSTNGNYSLSKNTTGFFNTANGYASLSNNTIGNGNTATGVNALFSNVNGNTNTANGLDALYQNISGVENLAAGYQALLSNTTGSSNTANGTQALYFNSTAGGNTATGNRSLYTNTTGFYNSASGGLSLYENSTGNYNTANGYASLYYNITGSSNTAYGDYSLYTNHSGSYNTAIGDEADVNNSNYSNTTIIGHFAKGTASNQVRIGNNAITSIGGYTNWTNISDGRVKKNIKDNVPGLEFINKLKPVTYNLDLDKSDKIVQRTSIKDSTNKGNDAGKMAQEENASRMAKEAVLYTGFIAQDVEKAAKSLNYNFSGVDAPKNDKDLYGLRYAEFVVPLVKSVQELSKENNELKKDNMDIKKDNMDIKKELADLKNLVTSMQQQSSTNGVAQSNSKTVGLSSASLEQNAPNPFSNVTTIGYTLPAQVTSAKIIITDKTGKTLKEILVSGSGKGTIQLDAATLSSGAYQYSLYVNSKLIDTKQMIRLNQN
ncbi:MAG: tail fiber domain-containing protein [Chitinophagaceae bacterium]